MAVGQVRPGGVVILGGGTTALAVGHALPKDLACTVITHSPTIAAARNVSAGLFLLGVTGVRPETGPTTGDAEDAAMERALVARAADTRVLGSAEKTGTASRSAD